MPTEMISNIFIGLVICWVILNIFWLVIILTKKIVKIHIPKEVEFYIKKTMKINTIYIVVFGLLGFILI